MVVVGCGGGGGGGGAPMRQVWCANHLTDAACSNDGGASYAMAPVGTAASVDATAWAPKAGAVVAGTVPGAGEVYSCVCLKKCSCAYMTKTKSGKVRRGAKRTRRGGGGIFDPYGCISDWGEEGESEGEMGWYRLS